MNPSIMNDTESYLLETFISNFRSWRKDTKLHSVHMKTTAENVLRFTWGLPEIYILHV